ncbi:MAG TPA: hypothetical protein VEX43_03825 [Chthoniobacterales bacterium]|nr:hypothetical protein [Chthoniobacterales bacterium]
MSENSRTTPWIYLPLNELYDNTMPDAYRRPNRNATVDATVGAWGRIREDSFFGHCLELDVNAGLTVSLDPSVREFTAVVWLHCPISMPLVEAGPARFRIAPSSGSAGMAPCQWRLYGITFGAGGQPQYHSPSTPLDDPPSLLPPDASAPYPLRLARLRIYNRTLDKAELGPIGRSDIAEVEATARNRAARDALLVPIHLDALVVGQDRSVLSLAPDLTRLPYAGVNAGVNAGVPNLFQSVAPQPFDAPGFLLRPGVHLHWALPDALTRGENGADGPLFPAVPNRWLVVNTIAGTVRGWLVESDYLYPEPSNDPGGVLVMRPEGAGVQGNPPYRRMGRAVSLDGPYLPEPIAERFPRLTAIGDGDPAFAALYPRCHSVFGFFDNSASAVQGSRFDVIGWYEDVRTDPLYALYESLTAAPGAAPTPQALFEAIEKRFKWRPKLIGETGLPRRVLCYGRLTFDVTASGVTTTTKPAPRVQVSVAQSSAEALSMHLARSIGGQTRLVEDQLESILLAAHLPEHAIQIGPQLEAARHAKGFSAVPGGTLWTIRRKDGAQTEAAPPEVMRDLDALNTLQRSFDSLTAEVASIRRQLFADWSKYMLSADAPAVVGGQRRAADAVKDFITRNVIPQLEDRIRPAVDAAYRLQPLRSALKARLAPPLVLQEIPAPRYYQPMEPVVLLAGPAVQPSDRHGLDGRHTPEGVLECHVLPRAPAVSWLRQNPYRQITDGLADTLARIAARATEETRIGFTTWRAPCWHPLLLQWEVEFAAPDPSGGAVPIIEHYRGTSILAQHARGQYKNAILDYLEDRILADYRKDKQIPRTQLIDLDTTLDAVESWYRQTKSPVATDPVLTALSAYRLLLGLPVLSQALSGFNDACLMLRQGPQLPVDEPLALPPTRSFSTWVRDFLGRSNRSTPDFSRGFYPIRQGVLKVVRLRLVDNFGDVLDLEHDAAALPLRPRIVQPARLELRWQSGMHRGVESNASASSTPICGWFLPNFIGQNVTVYDAAGAPLGIIGGEEQAAWQPAPGEAAAADLDRLGDQHLRHVLKGLVSAGGTSGTTKFLSLLKLAMENIEPEGHGEEMSPVFLFGRPLALARVSVNLALQGIPAVNQGWEALAAEIRNDRRAPAAFTQVQWPVRIGVSDRLDDGVVGYWRDGDPAFHSVLLERATPRGAINLAIDGTAEELCLLVDALGSVHAVSEILPAANITLPVEHCEAALKRIQVSHLAAPLLTPEDTVAIAMPDEPGRVWSWVERRGGKRVEIALERAGDTGQSAFSGPLRLREGWLSLRVEDKEHPE